MSDHEAVLFNLNIKPTKINKPPHKVHLYKSANWDGLKQATGKMVCDYFERNPNNLDIDTNWKYFKTTFIELMSTFIPSKMTKSKPHLPYITRDIIRLQRKRAYQGQKVQKKLTLGILQKP